MSDGQQSRYPIVILQDRYGGSYSGGAWIAIAQADTPIENTGMSRIAWAMDDGPSGDDITCSMFWARPPAWIASGRSADEAESKLPCDARDVDDAWTPTFLDDEHPAAIKWRAFDAALEQDRI